MKAVGLIKREGGYTPNLTLANLLTVPEQDSASEFYHWTAEMDGDHLSYCINCSDAYLDMGYWLLIPETLSEEALATEVNTHTFESLRGTYRTEWVEPLRDSLDHWWRLMTYTAKEGESWYGNDCALCKRYNTRDNECDGCPVKEYTGQAQCYGTPYYDARDEMEDRGTRRGAADMFYFLLSLMPEGYAYVSPNGKTLN